MNARLATLLIAAAAFGSCCGATAARADLPQQAAPNANLTVRPPWYYPAPPAPQPLPQPLFKIGNLPVAIWAPVEPPYNPQADRNLAADPLWYFPDGA